MNIRRSLSQKRRVVIKVGTTTLTYPNGKLNLTRIQRMAWVLTDLRNQGKEVVLVSSGAIAVGADRLGLAQRPRNIVGKQAASAVGQAILMQIYENFFMEYGQKVAQILITKDVVDDEVRKSHASNTMMALLEMGVIPIVNENDTVAIDELEFSDNDRLSAYVACLVKGDLLVILSDIDGLYDQDPRVCEDAQFISLVRDVQQVNQYAGDSLSSLGTGGMASKVIAADMATKAGIDVVIANGDDPSVILKILDGEEKGTFFVAQMSANR